MPEDCLALAADQKWPSSTSIEATPSSALTSIPHALLVENHMVKYTVQLNVDCHCGSITTWRWSWFVFLNKSKS
jgi:hypothetical protein